MRGCVDEESWLNWRLSVLVHDGDAIGVGLTRSWLISGRRWIGKCTIRFRSESVQFGDGDRGLEIDAMMRSYCK